jgi:hypothetical protein
MKIPLYWALAKGVRDFNGKQVSLSRYGWSDVSLDDAKEVANARLYEAINNRVPRKSEVKRETRWTYVGAGGLPICEEIVSTHGDVVITQNSYGSLCLKTLDL